jgi:hypothetical protein
VPGVVGDEAEPDLPSLPSVELACTELGRLAQWRERAMEAKRRTLEKVRRLAEDALVMNYGVDRTCEWPRASLQL